MRRGEVDTFRVIDILDSYIQDSEDTNVSKVLNDIKAKIIDLDTILCLDDIPVYAVYYRPDDNKPLPNISHASIDNTYLTLCGRSMDNRWWLDGAFNLMSGPTCSKCKLELAKLKSELVPELDQC